MSGLPGVRLRLSRRPTEPRLLLFEPMLYFVLQGAKRLRAGERALDYAGGQMVVMSVDLPVTGEVVQASVDAPYVALELLLDRSVIASLASSVPVKPGPPVEGFAVCHLPDAIADALCRLVALFDEPEDAPTLRPLIEREIAYRVLRGSHGALLRHFAAPDSEVSRIARAIETMRRSIEKPLRVGELADLAGMSATSFHRRFKEVTAMTPIAYHKRLRLLEARRRMVAEPRRAAHVGISVGYESASQFSREYKREFGLPPAQDATRLRRGVS